MNSGIPNIDVPDSNLIGLRGSPDSVHRDPFQPSHTTVTPRSSSGFGGT
jgi:hypothetical protein